jgi:hypothetical protein
LNIVLKFGTEYSLRVAKIDKYKVMAFGLRKEVLITWSVPAIRMFFQKSKRII